MTKYRYTGEIAVKCAGRLWEPGDEAVVALEIRNPHFTQVKAKPLKQEAPPDGNN